MMKLRLRLRFGGEIREQLFHGRRVRIGCGSDCDLVVANLPQSPVSSLHAEIIAKQDALWLIHRGQLNTTILRNQAIKRPEQIRPGDTFQLGTDGPQIEVLEFHPQSADAADSQALVEPAAGRQGASTSVRFKVGNGCVIGREGDHGVLKLKHPHVSRRHAMIKSTAGRTVLTDLRSANGTRINGESVKKATEIRPGDIIDIGPFSLVFDGASLSSRSRADNVSLDVNRVSFVISSLLSGNRLTLLNDITFRVNPGVFVAILVPSGSGKSTLLGIASGRNWPTRGVIKLNDRDLHRDFGMLKEDLVVVPQSAAMHETLTVAQTVRFAASLRLPPDTRSAEIQAAMDRQLKLVGLSDRASARVRQLSGGQLKRLGLACELVSDPSLLFLDEVTSGLDEKADAEMMQLFRQLADNGKTLVCVTHNLGNVQKFCHRILVLTVGGRVAFYGSPRDTLSWFGINSLSDIYAALDLHSPEHWNAKYCRRFQDAGTESVAAVRKPTNDLQAILTRIGLRPLAQMAILVRRYLRVWLGDPVALTAIFGQALLVTILLCLVFNSIPEAVETVSTPTGATAAATPPESDLPNLLLPSPRQLEIKNLLFLLGISCFWLGANNAAKEVIKERKIYQRERDFNLVPESFWASKIIVLTMIGTLQTVLLASIVILVCGLPGNYFAITGSCLLLSFLGTNLGLAISAMSKSEELAVAMVPVAIIPQIILAGVVAELSAVPMVLAKLFLTAFWGQKLLEAALPEADRIPADFEPNMLVCLAVLTIHLFVYLAATWGGIRFMRLKER